jgi:hypothetical protein
MMIAVGEEAIVVAVEAMVDTNFFFTKTVHSSVLKSAWYESSVQIPAQAECRLVLTSGARTGAEWIA